ncbi:beta-lactamase family protein, partial [Candidatus Poribacteria bacterium]|nr:beta-lactamase family protein [Candidatus Poribacteria bacterium]
MTYDARTRHEPATRSPAPELRRRLPSLMADALIPGLSIAVIEDGSLTWDGAFGVKHAQTGEPVQATTVFESASTGKAVFAYAVLKLVDRGELDLDTPLVEYTPLRYLTEGWIRPLLQDDRIADITARMALTHSTGFPNWPSDGGEFAFAPGTRWGYSGMAFVYLGATVVRVTGLRLDEFVRREALLPCGMTHSWFKWRDRFAITGASQHTVLARAQPMHRFVEPLAAGSLYTTAADFGSFLVAVLNSDGLGGMTTREMLRPQMPVDGAPNITWGLGIGLHDTPQGETIWHWGNNIDAKAYFEVRREDGRGFVYFANSRNGLAMVDEVGQLCLGQPTCAVSKGPSEFGRYDAVDSPVMEMCRAYRSAGPERALRLYREADGAGASLPPEVVAPLARDILALGDLGGGLRLGDEVARAHPDNARAHILHGEAHLMTGNQEAAYVCLSRARDLDASMVADLSEVCSRLVELGRSQEARA